MGLFTSKIEKHKLLLSRLALDGLAEDERIYRNHVALFSAEYQEAEVSPIGLLKARLHSSAFFAVAFRNRWGTAKPDDCIEAFNALSGLAAVPLVESGAISVESARGIGGAFFFSQLKFIHEELTEGPSSLGTGGMSSELLRKYSTPGALEDLPSSLGIANPERLERYFTQGPVPESFTPGFRNLMGTCHEALIHSVGEFAYENCSPRNARSANPPPGVEIKPRPRFERYFVGAIFSRLRALAELQEALG